MDMSRAAPAVVEMDAADRSRWVRPLVLLLLVWTGAVALYWETVESMVRVWIGSATYNHAFLILPISIYLLWQRRRTILAADPVPFWPALLPLSGATLVWLVADAAHFNEAKHFAFVTVLLSACLAVIGAAAFRRAMFPLLYLYFLVPTGEFLVPSLQDLTASFIVTGLRLIGIPVYREGYLIEIPTGLFNVAEACAGLRFLIASIAFGALFANVIYAGALKRVAFVAASIFVPIVANGFRALGIVLIAHATDGAIAAGVDHIVYGWGFFAAVQFLLIWIGIRFRDEPAAPPPAPPPGRLRRPFAAAGLAVALLTLSGPAVSGMLDLRADSAPRTALRVPSSVGGWTVTTPTTAWSPNFIGPDATVLHSFTDGERQVDLFIAYYGRQQHDRKVLSSMNRVAGDEAWRSVGQAQIMIPWAGSELAARQVKLRRGASERTVWQWFWIDGTYTSHPIVARLLQIKGRLLDQNQAGAAILVSTDERLDAARTLRDFVAALGSLDSVLAARSAETASTPGS